MVIEVPIVGDDTVEVVEISPTRSRKGVPQRKRGPNQNPTSLKNLRVTKPDVIVADFHTRSNLGYVPIDKIRIDYSYQRTPDKSRISIMAHNWDQDKVGVVVVSERADGFYYLVDGQQRFLAIDRIKNKPQTMLSQIFSGLSVEDEAKLFYELDTKRRGLTRGALFTALVRADDPAAREIIEAAEAVGLTARYANGNTVNNLRSFGTLMEVHKRVGKDELARILRIIAKAWPNSKHSGSGSVIVGLEKFFQRYPKVNESHLIEALSRTNIHAIDNNARALNSAMSGALGQWTARVIHSLYNKGMKANRLPSWQ